MNWRQSGVCGNGHAREPTSLCEGGRTRQLFRSGTGAASVAVRGEQIYGELEDELGVQLLNRTTRRVSPTENGQAYFERVLGILGELEAADQAVTQLQATPRGLLRVNAPMSFGTLQLGPAIAEFMQLYSIPSFGSSSC
jgi:regulatory helix-turn-helix LysR family protein